MCNHVYQHAQNAKQCTLGNLMPLPIDSEGRCVFHSKDADWKREQGLTQKFREIIKVMSAQDEPQYIFDECYFSEALTLEEGEHFSNQVSFADSRFAKEVCFEGCHFQKGLNLVGARFEDDLQISYGVIDSLIFNHGACHGDFSIQKVERPRVFSFKHSRFLGSFSFADICFDTPTDKVYFSNCVFESSDSQKKVGFWSTCFQEVYFDKTVFNAPLNFEDITFDNDAHFRDTQFLHLPYYNNQTALPTSFTDIIVGQRGKLFFRGNKAKGGKLFKRMTGLFFKHIYGKVFFEYVNFNFLSTESQNRIDERLQGRGSDHIKIGSGCQKYTHYTEPRTIKLSENYHEVITELSSTFIKYFKLSNGFNLGVEILEQTTEHITLYYFSDEDISTDEFQKRLRDTEVELWNLAYHTKEVMSRPAFSNKLVQLNDVMIDLKSLLFKIGGRISKLGLSPKDLSKALKTTSFGKPSVLNVESMHRSLSGGDFTFNILLNMGNGDANQVINKNQIIHGDINNHAKGNSIIMSGIARDINIKHDEPPDDND